MRYSIERSGEGKRITIHCEKRVPRITWFSLGEPMTPESTRLKETLLAIPGIVEVSACNYSLNIERAGVYLWDELEPQILAVLREQVACEETALEPVGAYR